MINETFPRSPDTTTAPKLSFACNAPWESMSGDERTKFCATCRRSIPNLSLMSAADRAALGEELKTERVCGSFSMRLTGEMVTPERPLTVPEKNRVRQFGVAALSASALAMATGCMAPHATTAQASPATASISVPFDSARSLSDLGWPRFLLVGGVIVFAPTRWSRLRRFLGGAGTTLFFRGRGARICGVLSPCAAFG
jgi:hypothetical protein